MGGTAIANTSKEGRSFMSMAKIEPIAAATMISLNPFSSFLEPTCAIPTIVRMIKMIKMIDIIKIIKMIKMIKMKCSKEAFFYEFSVFKILKH